MSMCALIFWNDLKRFLVSGLENIGSFNPEDNSIFVWEITQTKRNWGIRWPERINVRNQANHFEAIPTLSLFTISQILEIIKSNNG